MKAVLRELSEREREILTLYYLEGCSPEQIRQEWDVSEEEFRRLKSNAQARFNELWRSGLT